ncbi:hypothetical protein CTM86_04610 [Fusobacterium pseudoperiodonticum]|jgi:hypothetical protein|uniref:Uncharacterized protein n=1 Tax=Fusobacterium pseudoperiodonticum TaxID=2663009 RepID=A0AAD0ART4_9FUSO|nr:hypothetical protein [Fusobacterium pseudoperiodonticum]ATV65924.1 hypothetical protein CTM86_04610 [Fusobacterium pseudoperiodonticum]
MEEFYVLLNISSNLKEEKLLHRYEMFIRDIKRTLKDNNFNEHELNLEANSIFINILNKSLKEINDILKCLAYIQIMAIEKYNFLLKGVVEYIKEDLVDSFEEEKEFDYPLIMLGDSIKEDVLENFSQSLIKISDKFYINYLSVYYEDNNDDDFFNIMLKHKKFIKERLIENSKEFYKIMGVSGKRILEKQFFYKEFESRKYQILERLEHVKKLHNLEEIKKQKNYLLEFEKDLKKQEEDFSQTKAELNDNEKNILKIREKYLYLLNYHNKIVFSLIKFGSYKEDRRRSCSINLEEII